MNKFTNSLKILRGLEKDCLFAAAAELYDYTDDCNRNNFISAVFSARAEDGLFAYIQSLILYDENPFSVACAIEGKPSERLKKAFAGDLNKINAMLEAITPNGGEFAFGTPLPLFDAPSAEETANNLMHFYARNGYGQFAKYKAFVYRDKQIVPVGNPVAIKLSDLKDYEEEKRLIINNVSDFLGGLPYSHMLLYGDRGTGKSSTVQAVLNKFADGGLRLIEVGKEDIAHIKEIRETVARFPLKFLIFTDDLTFDEQDPSVSSLKAAVEGSVVGGANSMIVATSNRRHIVSESFAERENSLHPSDLKEERLSLSDRFGLTVIFSSTDKNAYLSIVRQLAKERGLTMPVAELEALAERWAIVKGGRSPRRAEQLVNLAYACMKANRKIEF